jgi:pentafunctional AROM polypeptide
MEDFSRFLSIISGRGSALVDIRKKNRSYFVCLTFPDLRQNVELLQSVVVGCDAVELRVDLLEDPTSQNGLCGLDYLIDQTALLRSAVSVPIIFTLRTISQGGKFPDDALDHALALYRTAIRLAFDFIDLEITSPDSLLNEVSNSKGYSKIIASHHDPKGELSWADGSWIPHYNKALQYGDVIKLVGFAHTYWDNYELANFRKDIKQAHSTPLIAMNMGELGKLSRIENDFMTPVSHPKLATAAAPGQLSAAQIRQALALQGLLPAKKFYIFGYPVSGSFSPALHNTLFSESGLPNHYTRHETDKITDDVKKIIRSPDFGGASVTIPLKQDILPLVDEVGDDAEAIGAANTLIPEEQVDGSGKTVVKIVARNTDWQGMVLVLRNAGAVPGNGELSGLVIGGGGTARAAIYALQSMGYSPIFLVGRSPDKMAALAKSFPIDYDLRVIPSKDEASKLAVPPPTTAIGTIPANMPVDPNMEEILKEVFKPASDEPSIPLAKSRILLEMAYKPVDTPVKLLAESLGWKTANGLEVLVGQGVYQFKHWTGITPLYETAHVSIAEKYLGLRN